MTYSSVSSCIKNRRGGTGIALRRRTCCRQIARHPSDGRSHAARFAVPGAMGGCTPWRGGADRHRCRVRARREWTPATTGPLVVVPVWPPHPIGARDVANMKGPGDTETRVIAGLCFGLAIKADSPRAGSFMARSPESCRLRADPVPPSAQQICTACLAPHPHRTCRTRAYTVTGNMPDEGFISAPVVPP